MREERRKAMKVSKGEVQTFRVEQVKKKKKRSAESEQKKKMPSIFPQKTLTGREPKATLGGKEKATGKQRSKKPHGRVLLRPRSFSLQKRE